MSNVNILVVTDTQVDFATGSLGKKEAVATIPNIVRRIADCGNAGYSIFETRDSHDENYLNTNEGKHLPIPHTIIGTEGWSCVPAIRDVLYQYNAVTIIKDVFGSSDLANVIRVNIATKLGKMIDKEGRGLRITIIGWCTDICVIANVILLKTAFPEAEIIVDSSCCAGVTPESHEAALTVMRSCQITVI